MTLLLILTAGAIGATLRFLLSKSFNGPFPLGTTVANLSATFLLGFLVGITDETSDTANLILGVGGLGALSVWSTLANEVATMSRRGEGKLAATYLWFMTVSGVLLAWCGIFIGESLT